MEQIKCMRCGESNLNMVGINDDNMINCKDCGSSTSVKDYLEMNNLSLTEGEFIMNYRNLISEETTMADALEIANSNIEFSKKHTRDLNRDYDDSDLPF